VNSIVRYIKPWFESVITNISVTCMRDYGTAESMPHASLYDTLNTFFCVFQAHGTSALQWWREGFCHPGETSVLPPAAPSSQIDN